MSVGVALPGFGSFPLPGFLFGTTVPGQPSGIIFEVPPFFLVAAQSTPAGLTVPLI